MTTHINVDKNNITTIQCYCFHSDMKSECWICQNNHSYKQQCTLLMTKRLSIYNIQLYLQYNIQAPLAVFLSTNKT